MRQFVAKLWGCASVLTFVAQVSIALPSMSFQQAELFAVCSGRLAALATHQKYMKSSDSSDSERLRREFDMLLDAVLPDAESQGVPPGQAKRWRSQGWAEMAGYLADVQYSFDQSVADTALAASASRVEQCRDVLLPTPKAG